MAIVYRAQNDNAQEVEAYIQQKTKEHQAYEKRKAKKRPWLLTLYILLIVLAIGGAAYVFFVPGALERLCDFVKSTLSRWAEDLHLLQLDISDIDQFDYSEGLTIKNILLGLWRFFLSFLMILAGFLLRALKALSSVLVPVVIILTAGFVAYFSWDKLGYVGWKPSTPEEIKAFIIKGMDSHMAGLYAGVEGELEGLELISTLPDDCYVFFNVDVCGNESDFIVLSQSGLTVVESKAYSGILQGSLSDPKLTQIKGNKGEDRKNPFYQVKIPARKLEAFLRRNGITVQTQRAVLFTKDNVELQVTDHEGIINNCPMFFMHKDAGSFLRYLRNPHRRCFSEEEMVRIVAAIRTLI